MSQPEGQLARNIVKQLTEEFGGFWFKVHGGPFQKAGIPDIIGCVEGRFYALEVKMPGNRPTPLQLAALAEISAAGGLSCWVTTVEGAVSLVQGGMKNYGCRFN